MSHGSNSIITISWNWCQAFVLSSKSRGRLLTIQRIILLNDFNILSSIRVHTRQDVNTWHVDIIIVLMESNVSIRRDFLPLLIITKPARSYCLLFEIIDCFVQLFLSFLKYVFSLWHLHFYECCTVSRILFYCAVLLVLDCHPIIFNRVKIAVISLSYICAHLWRPSFSRIIFLRINGLRTFFRIFLFTSCHY